MPEQIEVTIEDPVEVDEPVDEAEASGVIDEPETAAVDVEAELRSSVRDAVLSHVFGQAGVDAIDKLVASKLEDAMAGRPVVLTQADLPAAPQQQQAVRTVKKRQAPQAGPQETDISSMSEAEKAEWYAAQVKRGGKIRLVS